MHPIVTLTTDFGGTAYASSMKGRILQVAPSAQIIDITHSITPQNIMEGAYIMWSIIPHFPYAIHVGVVDPGVGTGRRGIVMDCQKGILVGPDNGILWPSAQELGLKESYRIDEQRLGKLGPVSSTFHGRDIFAPIAANLAIGNKPSEMGEPMTDPMRLDMFFTDVQDRGTRLTVLHTDPFGNLILNLKAQDLGIAPGSGRSITFSTRKRSYTVPLVRTYGEAEGGDLMATISSSELLEISVSSGNASKTLGIGTGDEIILW